MGARGPAPKDGDKRLGHRAADPVTSLGPAPKTAPALPSAADYSPETRRWYRVWAQSPQASQFTDTDWQRLHMLAPMVESYFENSDPRTFGEIRINEAKLGATPEDRQRLRWKVAEEEPQQAATRTPSRRRKDPRHLASVQ